MDKIIEFNHISKIFDNHSVLKDFTLAIRKGEFVVIKGPSGSGKTTLLNLIGMLDNPSSGQYIFDQHNVSQLTNVQKASLRNSKIGYVFQMYHLVQSLNVSQNILLPMIYSKSKLYPIDQLLEKFMISQLKHSNVNHLSGGEKQRVCLARALVMNPSIILADEPTGSLDSINTDHVRNHLIELNREGRTVIVVSHSSIFDDFATQVIMLGDNNEK